MPVIAPIGVGNRGRSLRHERGPVAGAIAAALNAEKLVLLTDVAGVLGKHGNLIHSLGRRVDGQERGPSHPARCGAG